MIEDVDTRLAVWAERVAGPGVRVSLEPPADGNGGTGVSVFLLELAAQPPLRSERRAPLQLALRYLVTTWAAEPSAAHALLGRLVLGAMEEEGVEVQLAPLPAATWTSFGAAPRASFVLQVPVRRPRPEPAAPRVRGPLTVRGTGLVSLAGVVLGPGGVPVAGARVEIPSAGAAAATDAGGRFAFSGLPAEPARKHALVTARGRRLEVDIERPEDGRPLAIHFDQLLEE